MPVQMEDEEEAEFVAALKDGKGELRLKVEATDRKDPERKMRTEWGWKFSAYFKEYSR
jgi:hypothetical protein